MSVSLFIEGFGVLLVLLYFACLASAVVTVAVTVRRRLTHSCLSGPEKRYYERLLEGGEKRS
jgi:hypothetical protein